jgi:hypothetical protein
MQIVHKYECGNQQLGENQYGEGMPRPTPFFTAQIKKS